MNRKLILFLISTLILRPAYASMDFDGSLDYLNCGSGLVLEKNDMSLTAWIDSNIFIEPAPRMTIVSHKTIDAGTINLEMYLDDGSGGGFFVVLGCDLMDSGGTLQSVTMDLGDDTGWKHVACIWNGTDLTPYVNAIAGTPLTIGAAANTDEGDLTIGARSTPDLFYPGQITDVNYYRRVLTLSEIQTLVYSRMRSDVIPTTSRDGHWPLDDLANATTVGTNTFLNRASPGTNNCVGTGAGGIAYADFLRYR